jgi:hypothetical protein
MTTAAEIMPTATIAEERTTAGRGTPKRVTVMDRTAWSPGRDSTEWWSP